MKILGMLGGTSWPSTIDYYRYLNQLAQRHLGAEHSARLLLRSIDYAAIRSHYPNGWDAIAKLLKAELDALAAAKPDYLMVCNNTLHQALDIFLPEIKLPVIHIIDAAARRARFLKCKSLLLLATKPTMEGGYYTQKLEAAGFTVTIPDAAEREKVQAIQSQMAKGVMHPEFRTGFKEILDRYQKLDGVVLGCTELPLAIGPEETPLARINTLEAQCDEAFAFAVAGEKLSESLPSSFRYGQESGGPKGPEPTRYNDWEIGGKAVDF